MVLGVNDDGTADVFTSNRKLRVNVEPNLEIKALEVGQEVLLNESYNIVDVRTFDGGGEVVAIKESLGEGRLLVLGRADEERVVELGAPLRNESLRAGDHVRIEPKTGLALEKLVRPEVEELVLEEVPDVTYDEIGGLESRSRSSAMQLSFPTSTRSGFRITACRRRKASCSTALPAVARP